MSLKNVHIETSKLAIGTPDLSKTTFPDLMGSGTLVNPGVSLFGGALSVGAAKAAVNIGPPLGSLSLPNSLWVDGSSVFMGMVSNFGLTYHYGMTTMYGVCIKNAASMKNGISLKNSLGIGNVQVQDNTTHTIAGALTVGGVIAAGGNVSAPMFFGNIAACIGKKNFDIPHPTKKDHRLRHVCVEGPTADVYIRGKLTDSNVINLPDYWKELVDLDGITVQLQPIGDRHFHLNVVEITDQKIIVKEADDKPFECFYHVYGERKDCERNIAEYKGLTIGDYPGDNTESIINGV